MTPTEIKKIREKLGVTQEALSHLIGVSFQTVNRWERGISKPSRLAIEKIITLSKKEIVHEH